MRFRTWVAVGVGALLVIVGCGQGARAIGTPTPMPKIPIGAPQVVMTETAIPVAGGEEDQAQLAAEDPTATAIAGGEGCVEWQTYRSADSGFSISYPCGWALESGSNANSYTFSTGDAVGHGGLMWFWVSVLPQGQTFENGSVYNFMEDSFLEGVSGLAVGGSMAENFEGEELAQYWTYTRLADRDVSGRTAVIIENSKPWEFPEGTRDRRAVLLVDGTWYVIGGYTNTDEGLGVFEKILDEFSIDP